MSLAPALDSAVANFEKDLAGLSVGRAAPTLVENLLVEAHGSRQPLKALAQISVPEATQLLIQPWDPSLVEAIAKAITDSDLGVNPQNDGRVIRVILPPLTEERRRELAKKVSQLAEKARIAVRNLREDARKELKKREKEMPKDDFQREEKELQDLVNKANATIAEREKKKEAALLEI